MALVNGGFLHYRDMKKFLKNLLLRNCWSDFEIISQECSFGDPVCMVQKNLVLRNYWSGFEIISQESGFDISRRPDCQIRAVIATGKLP